MSDLTPDVQAALDNLRTVNWDHLGAGELADAEQLVVERIQSAYRSALAGETPESLVEVAAKAMAEAGAEWERDYNQWCEKGDGPCPSLFVYRARAAAPILRASLLLQLQELREASQPCSDCVYCSVHRQRGDTVV